MREQPMEPILPLTPITIALVKSQQDWQRIEQINQYHVPLQHYSRTVPSSWIAFYLPRWHMAHPYSIHFVASIQSVAVMQRVHYLPDESAHPRATHHYVVYTLGSMYQFRTPIVSLRWRRITLHQSTFGALARAYDLGNLSHIQRTLNRVLPHADDTDMHDHLFVPRNHPPDAHVYSTHPTINRTLPTQ